MVNITTLKMAQNILANARQQAIQHKVDGNVAWARGFIPTSQGDEVFVEVTILDGQELFVVGPFVAEWGIVSNEQRVTDDSYVAKHTLALVL